MEEQTNNKRAKPIEVIDLTQDSEEKAPLKVLTPEEILAELDRCSLDLFGKTFKELEASKEITAANDGIPQQKLPKGSKPCEKAQFGSASPAFVAQLVQLLNLGPESTVYEWGAGDGLAMIAFHILTKGAAVLGYEICPERTKIAQQLIKALGLDDDKIQIYNCDLRVFAKQNIMGFCCLPYVDCVFVNNAMDVFGSRAELSGEQTPLDDEIAKMALYNLIKKDAKLVCLQPLQIMDKEPYSQCFHREEFLSAPGAFSWTETSQSKTKFYVYTRVQDKCLCPKNHYNSPVLYNSVDHSFRLRSKCHICEEPLSLKKTRSAFKRKT